MDKTLTSFDKAKIRVLLLEGIHPSAKACFERAGYTHVTEMKEAISGATLSGLVDEYHILGIRSRTQLTAEVLRPESRLMAVGCFCIGTNQVNLERAAELAIPVFNAPFSNTRSVAELVIGEAILLLRGVVHRTVQVHDGIWEKSAQNAFEIRGKTLGIVGYGNIGSQLGVLAESLGMRVRFYDVQAKLRLGNAEQVGSLEDLLLQSDVVSLHVPATEQTNEMINAEALAHMNSKAVLINASRGHVVDLTALAEAIRSEAILGAAVDVYPEEPTQNGASFSSPLQGLPNVILTPHIGGSTVEAQVNIATEVAEKLIHYSDNGSTTSAVNFPEVALPSHPGKHRLLHVHRNVPGVLNAVNSVFSDAGINVAAQYLMTKDQLGYVVIDIDAEYTDASLTALRAIDGTIRTRILF